MQNFESVTDLGTPLPIDDNLVHGTLDNGLSYYIRANQRPQNRVDLRLVVKVGSILEDEDQLGLAHIVEHMAFNGTKRFAPREIVSYFESIGAKFGAHLNAYTSFDETVYKLHIPMDDPKVLERSLALLRDWAADLLFLPDEIERERKVGLEEWRQGRNANARLREKLLPKLYYNSKYVDRRPIGTEKSLLNFDHAALKRFYSTWYRPELMSVIVVGDCSPDEIKTKIIDHFSDLVNAPDRSPRIYEQIPMHETSFYDVFYDEEITQSSISFLSKRISTNGNTHGDYRADLVQSLAINAINERLLMMTQRPNAPFVMAHARIQVLNLKTIADLFTAVIPERQFEACTNALLKELARARRFGLSKGEFMRAKKGILSDIKAAYEEKDTTSSSKLTHELVRVVTTNESVPGIEYEREMVQKYLSEITHEEVNQFLASWMSSPSKLINIVTGEAEHPTSEKLETWVDSAQFDHLVPPPDDHELPPLITELPSRGNIQSIQHHEDIDVEELILTNGSKIWLKNTHFESDKILFSQSQKGGLSLADDLDLIPASTAAQMMFQSGVGSHDLSQLYRLLAGTKAISMPIVNNVSHGFSGFTTNEHLEMMLQLNYLQNHQPRFDEDVLIRQREVHSEQIRNKLSDPQTIFAEKIQSLWWNQHPRYMPWTLEHLDQFDLKQSAQFYQFLMGPTLGRHYIFVGNLDKNQLYPLIETYLDIPSEKAELNITKREDPRLKEVVKESLSLGSEPVGHYEMSTIVRMNPTLHDRLKIHVLKELLNLKLRRKFREERGDVYSISVTQQLSEFPVKAVVYSFNFSCDPLKLDDIVKDLHEELNEFFNEVGSEDDLLHIKEQILRSHETSLRENRSWLKMLKNALKRNEDPSLITAYSQLISDLRIGDLNDHTNTYFNMAHRLELKMFPQRSTKLP